MNRCNRLYRYPPNSSVLYENHNLNADWIGSAAGRSTSPISKPVLAPIANFDRVGQIFGARRRVHGRMKVRRIFQEVRLSLVR
jgi:hypothetical protein